MTPVALYQQALDAVSAAVLAGDFSAYLARMDLPYLLRSLHTDFVLHTPAELEPTFRTMSGMLHRNGATDYIRLARDADKVRHDRIEGWHHTHIISGGERVICPWAARQAIVLRGGVWKFSEAHYPFAVESLPLTEDMLRGARRPAPPPPPAIAPIPALRP